MNGRRLESDAELLRRFRNVFGLTLSDVEHPFGLSRVTWERIERGEVVLKRGVPVVIREIRSLMEMIGETIPEDDVHKWAVRPLGRDDKSPRDLVVTFGGVNIVKRHLSGNPWAGRPARWIVLLLVGWLACHFSVTVSYRAVQEVVAGRFSSALRFTHKRDTVERLTPSTAASRSSLVLPGLPAREQSIRRSLLSAGRHASHCRRIRAPAALSFFSSHNCSHPARPCGRGISGRSNFPVASLVHSRGSGSSYRGQPQA